MSRMVDVEMKKLSRVPRWGRARRSLAVTALAVAAAAAPLPAQEGEAHWTWRNRARIGVMLEEVCESGAGRGAACAAPPVVTSVVVGGPADAAGVEARDTLLAVDGLDVTRPEGRALLLGLQAGVPVELELGRSGGRRVIQVTPEARPSEPYVEVRTMFGPPPGADATAVSGARVVRLPSLRTRIDEMEVTLDSLRQGGGEFVFFHDSSGQLQLEVGGPERARVVLERLREAGEDAGTAGVWENEALARRLAQVRESSFRTARASLDSLVRLRGHVRLLDGDSLRVSVEAADPEGRWAYRVTGGELPAQYRTLFVSDLRVGGAEFRRLSGAMAEYFEGADEGLLVLRVIPGTPAARMGLTDGDVVVEVNGARCNDVRVLRQAVAGAEPGRGVEVKWVRKGTTHVGTLDVR